MYEYVWGGGCKDSVQVEVSVAKSLELFTVWTINVMFIITASSKRDQDMWGAIVVLATAYE